jgi:uncharacterized membrane protein YbhN (UPF0104 family)
MLANKKAVNKLIITILKSVILLGPLVWLIFGVKWATINDLLSNIPWWTAPCFFLLIFIRTFFQSLRFRQLLAPFNTHIGIMAMYICDMKARYYSTSIPSSLGQDIVRGTLMRNHILPSEIVSISIFFRITGLLPLLVMASVGVYPLSTRPELHQFSLILFLLGLLFGIGVTCIMSMRCIRGGLFIFEKFIPQKASDFLLNVAKGLHFYRKYRYLVLKNLLLSTFCQILVVLATFITVFGITRQWYPIEIFSLVPVIEIIAITFPFAPNGAGMREAMYLLLFTMLGRSKEEMLVFISINALGHVINCTGGFFILSDWLMIRKNKNTKPQ